MTTALTVYAVIGLLLGSVLFAIDIKNQDVPYEVAEADKRTRLNSFYFALFIAATWPILIVVMAL
jgi:hypothetical protein